MSNFCPNCGASVDSVARFCRRCGQELTVIGSVTDSGEATTRTLDEQSGITQSSTNPFTQVVNPGFTSPAYIPPGFESMAPQGFQPPQSKGRKGLIIAAIMAILILVAIGISAPFLVSYIGRHGHTPVSATEVPDFPPPPEPPSGAGGSAGIPKVPPVPAVPPVPVIPQVPEPPNNGGASTATGHADLDALVYPGAEITMQVNKPGKKQVLQLQTSDPIKKVTDWYVAKMHPTSRIIPPFDVVTILKSDDAAAVLTQKDGGTQIILTKD